MVRLLRLVAGATLAFFGQGGCDWPWNAIGQPSRRTRRSRGGLAPLSPFPSPEPVASTTSTVRQLYSVEIVAEPRL